MQLTLNKLAVLFASMAIAFGAALTAYAYDNLEIEIDIDEDGTEVDVTYDDENGDEVEEEYEYESTDIDEIYTLLATDLELTEEEVVAAVTSVEDENEDEEEDENEDENEESSEEEAENAITDAAEEIEKAAEVIADAAADGKEVELSSTTLAEARALLEGAEAAFADGDYTAAEDLADEAEDLAKLARMKYIDKTEEDVADYDEDRSEFCERTKKAAGWGVARKCVEDEDWEVNDKLQKKVEKRSQFEGYGQSEDRAELQNQLRELLTLLIQLMQQQMALQEANS